MKVTAEQLSDILDAYIILTDVRLVKNSLGIGTFEGIIDNISKNEIRITKPHSTLIYNDSFEREDYCEDVELDVAMTELREQLDLLNE